MNLVIEQGKTTAIVGASGSGKSTVAKLLERFYDPQEGSVKIFTQNLTDFNLLSYWQKVGYVSQEPVLFNESIWENLLYCNPGATEEQILISLNKANAKKIIDKLADGIDTNVGSAGGQLSGGEKQRIALAWAFIKNPSILLLDEATSALDWRNEAEVQEAIDKIIGEGYNKITTVVIAHWLSTIQNADKIIVMEKGQVVEEGTHQDLL